MIAIKKIIWNFEDTEFEDCNYEESRKVAILPKSLKIQEEDLDSDACEEDIVDYLVETYNFEVKSIKLEKDD
tara:strand:+ start:157 stop:372 length:216 start_codon:yes stop_codon:yes gene_type:complete